MLSSAVLKRHLAGFFFVAVVLFVWHVSSYGYISFFNQVHIHYSILYALLLQQLELPSSYNHGAFVSS